MAPDAGDDESGAEDEDSESGGRISESADRAVEGFDEGVIDLLSWVLDTETRARIYVHLRSAPDSTSKEIAEGTGLYPSTVREALAELHEDGVVTRQKRESEGAGNNPYEYAAIAPSDLVSNVVDQIQGELNAVFRLDDRLGGESEGEGEDESESESEGDADDASGATGEDPVTITVEDGDETTAETDVPVEGDGDGNEAETDEDAT
ncbi:transcriptional regulator [Halobacteriales archaeon SW_7_71_33]|nr:MAG: transcriptional regulator [Halobacteriales archaeon SW_7_71_33]